MRKLRYSERRTAFILTKAATVCPRGDTNCSPIVPEAPGLLAFQWPHNRMITGVEMASGRIQPFPQPSPSAVSLAAFAVDLLLRRWTKAEDCSKSCPTRKPMLVDAVTRHR
jgi:hypothetical protein